MASSQENVQPQQKMHMGWELSMAVGRSLPDRCSATEQSRLGGLLGEWGDLGEIIFFVLSVEGISELRIFLWP